MENLTATERNQISRDSKTQSIWQEGPFSFENNSKAFNNDTTYDALIVGGGITGLTTALLLQKQGKQCVLAEAYTLGFGTTGGTSAHLNTFFDTTYPEVEQDFGEDSAKLLAECGKESFGLIEQLVKEYNIDCDLAYKNGYLYAETDAEVEVLDEILEATKRAGIAAEEANTNGVSVPFGKSIVLKNQGQFHPIKYIVALAQQFVATGGIILENTFIRDTSYQDGVHTAKADDVYIKAKNLVYATHLPPGLNLMDFYCAPYRYGVQAYR
jgi:glycine/D-amino acid oxidase-like deaminating enzyme